MPGHLLQMFLQFFCDNTWEDASLNWDVLPFLLGLSEQAPRSAR